MTVICRNCGSEIPDGLRKCIICGAELEARIDPNPVEKNKVIELGNKNKQDNPPKKKYVRKHQEKQTEQGKQEKKAMLTHYITWASIGAVFIFLCIGSMGGMVEPTKYYTPHSAKDTTQEESAPIEAEEYDISLDCNESTIELAEGESRELFLTASGEDVPDKFVLYPEDSYENTEWVWGGWIDTKTITVFCTGLSEGEERVRFRLNDYNDEEKTYAETYIDVKVIPKDEVEEGSQEEIDEECYIVSDIDSLHLSVGESQETTISVGGINLPEAFYIQILSTNVVSSKWGEWISDNDVSITFTGEEPGRVKLKVSMYDSDTDKEVAHSYINLEVE